MTATERYQQMLAVALDKLDAAWASAGPTYTVPGGATLNRMQYIESLQAQIEWLQGQPGVVPEMRPTFEVWG